MLKSKKTNKEKHVRVVSEDEDAALKYYDDDDADDDSSIDTATTCSVITTTTTKTITSSTKFVRFRQLSEHKRRGNIYDINEHEMTEMSQMTKTQNMTEMTQTEYTEYTQTAMTKNIPPDLDENDMNEVVVISGGDEIKCCSNKLNIYTACYIIFAYNVFIAVLLLLIIIWGILFTDIPYFIGIWCVLFIFVRIFVAVIGFIFLPRMVGLHGNELSFLKEKHLKLMNVWSMLMLYGPIIFNLILLIAFIAYSIVLSLILMDDNDDNNAKKTPFGAVTIYENVDDFTAKFLLFCMGFICIIAVIDTICEILFYDTVKRFFEAKLQSTLCPIPCQQTNDE